MTGLTVEFDSWRNTSFPGDVYAKLTGYDIIFHCHFSWYTRLLQLTKFFLLGLGHGHGRYIVLYSICLLSQAIDSNVVDGWHHLLSKCVGWPIFPDRCGQLLWLFVKLVGFPWCRPDYRPGFAKQVAERLHYVPMFFSIVTQRATWLIRHCVYF